MSDRVTHRYKELRLAQLRAFCECVQHKSFSAAARAMKRSHATVWLQVRALERVSGVTLLQRHGQQLLPTEDGRVLWEMAHTILGSVDSLWETFSQRRQEVPRDLVVIGSPGVLAEELVQPVVDFARDHAAVKLVLLSHAGGQSVDLLISGDADLAVLPVDDSVVSNRQILVVEPLCERPLALALPEEHPLARKRQLTIADLVRFPLILPAPTNFWRQHIDGVFREAGVLEEVKVLLEVSHSLAARRYVSQGLGIALYAQPRNSVEFVNVRTRLVNKLFPSVQIVVLWHRGVTPRPQARLFAEYARARLA